MKRRIKDTAISASSSVIGASTGLVIAGPLGAVVGGVVPPVLTDVLSRMLSKNEKSRIEKITDLALEQIKEKIEKGIKPTKNLKNPKIKELFEGTLLAAKDTYEEKKLPFMARLFSIAPFTNTPVENILQSLITAEQLSYRQLCVLSVVGQNEWGNKFKLADKPLANEQNKMYDETSKGIYEDLNYLVVLGIVGQVLDEHAGAAVASGVSLIAPSKVVLLYPGRLMFNGMMLDYVDKNDIQEVVNVLK